MISRVSVVLLLCLVTVSHSKEVGDGDKCSFNSENYSLRWRYEKSTNNVIFFLKTSADAEGNDFWSGIGFGEQKQNVASDFVSVFVKKGQFGLADMHAGGNGELLADTFTNVQIISFDVEKGKLSAQFSRSLSASDESDIDLMGCTRFFYPNRPFTSKDSEKKTLKSANVTSEIVCDIAKHCEIDDPGLLSGSGSSATKNVEIALSVDKSGTGDPCSFHSEGYDVSWKYNKRKGTVDFDMRFPMKGGKWWSSVAIGDTMEDMDMVIFFLDNGIFKSYGDYFSSGYTVPSKDLSQDWHAEKKDAKVVDGIVHLKFSRALETDDKRNDRSLDGCVLFQFAANLGKYGSKYSIRKHEDWPDLYKACGLKERCASGGKRPRFAQAKDEVVQDIQKIEGSGEEPEHFTTTEPTPAEVIDGAEVNATENAVPLNAVLEADGLLTTAPAPETSSTAPVVAEAESEDTMPIPTTLIPPVQELSTEAPTTVEVITEATTSAEQVTEASNTAESITSAPAEASTPAPAEASTVSEVAETAAPTVDNSVLQQGVVTEAPEASAPESSTPEIVAESQTPESTTPKCDANHEDLNVCKNYIDDYFGEVSEWARKHNETVEAQRWKACSLLHKVPHVPDLCCTSFLEVCRNHLPQPQQHSGSA